MDRECEMLNARRAVRRHGSARRLERRQRRTALKEQQNTLPLQVERDEPTALQENACTEYPDVKCLRALEILDVDRGFHDAPNRRGGFTRVAGVASFGHVDLTSRRLPPLLPAKSSAPGCPLLRSEALNSERQRALNSERQRALNSERQRALNSERQRALRSERQRALRSERSAASVSER